MDGFKHAASKYIHTDNSDRLRRYRRSIEDEFYRLHIEEGIKYRREGKYTSTPMLVDDIHAASIQQPTNKKNSAIEFRFDHSILQILHQLHSYLCFY